MKFETTYYNWEYILKDETGKNRFFANLSYETPLEEGESKQWKFDATFKELVIIN